MIFKLCFWILDFVFFMKVALVHDFLLYWGGAEHVLKGLHKIFPEASIFTLFYNRSFTNAFFSKAQIHPSFLQKWAFFGYRWLLPFLPTATESLILDGYDLIISSGVFSKGIITKPSTLHIHYCHTLPRFLWEESKEYISDRVPLGFRTLAALCCHWLRLWDRAASERVDHFIANSQWTAARIQKIYGRDSKVIYPFVENSKFRAPNFKQIPNPKFQIQNDYYLIVSRLQSYKNIELPIRVFNKLGSSLFIIGEGSDRKRLERLAKKNIKFLGFQEEDPLTYFYKNAKAAILPGTEDFGLTSVEAMSQGTPVLAYRKGGALETVIGGKTGEFFEEQSEESFLEGLKKIRVRLPYYKKEEVVKYAKRFSFERFKKEILKFVEAKANI